MLTRRTFLQSSAAVAAITASARSARAETPGVTDTEIKIGQTMPYSGPASAYGVIGKADIAYFKMINEQGGDQRPQDQSDQPRRWLQPAEDRRADAPPHRAGAGRLPVQPARHSLQRRDPPIPQRQQSAAALRRDRRVHLRRPGALSVDDGLAAELPNRSDTSSASTSCKRSPTRRSESFIQNDGFGKDYLVRSEDGARSRARRHGGQGSVVRDVRADRQFAGGHAARFWRGRVRHSRNAQVRRAGDPQVLRHWLERRAHT